MKVNSCPLIKCSSRAWSRNLDFLLSCSTDLRLISTSLHISKETFDGWRLQKTNWLIINRCTWMPRDYPQVIDAILLVPALSGCYVSHVTSLWWMLRLSRSLSRFETQDIMTQPLFNHWKGRDTSSFLVWITLGLSWVLPLVLGLDAWVFSLHLQTSY